MKSKSVFFLIFTFFLLSCEKKSNLLLDTTVSEHEFEKSVALIHNLPLNISNNEYALNVKVKNFNINFTLNQALIIGCVEYCDNGKFNDKINGDGIYTSIDKFILDPSKFSNPNEIIISKSDKFAYNDDLTKFLNQGNLKSLALIKIGCKLRSVKCPNIHWYDTSLYGEKCIEFYDCSFELGF